MLCMKLPAVSGEKIVKALTKAGFEIVGRKGSHVRLKKKTSEKTYIVVVPLHTVVAKNTFFSIIRQSGMSKEEFIELLKKV